MVEIVEFQFSMLDLFLVPLESLQDVVATQSFCTACLATDRLFVCCRILGTCAERSGGRCRAKHDRAALSDLEVRRDFASTFKEGSAKNSVTSNSAEGRCSSIKAGFHEAEQGIPERRRVPNKPWISGATLALIQESQNARERGDGDSERRTYACSTGVNKKTSQSTWRNFWKMVLGRLSRKCGDPSA